MTAVSLGPGRPQLEVEAAFGSLPFATSPTWTSLNATVLASGASRYVRGVTAHFGRQEELARIEAATATLKLSNRDGAFDSRNTASPFYPNVKPMVRIRIWARYASTDYMIFVGYAETWPRARAGAFESEVAVELVDALAAIATAEFTLSAPQENTGARVQRILDAIGVPSAFYSIETGKSTMPAKDYENANAVESIREAETAEFGVFFASAAGVLTFQNRHHRYLSQGTSQGTFADAGALAAYPSALPYVDLTPELAVSRIVNRASFTAAGGSGTPQTVLDTTSRDQYRLRSQSSDLELTDDGIALDAAHYTVAKYAQPFERVTAIGLKPRLHASIWPHALGRAFGDRVTVVEKPPGSSATYAQQLHIEGWEHDIVVDSSADGGRWETKWQLSPAELDAFWVLGDPVNGVLGSTTRLAF